MGKINELRIEVGEGVERSMTGYTKNGNIGTIRVHPKHSRTNIVQKILARVTEHELAMHGVLPWEEEKATEVLRNSEKRRLDTAYALYDDIKDKLTY